MYDVEALTPYVWGGALASEWEDIYNVPQMATDQEELQEAQRIASQMEGYYRNVRVVHAGLGGIRSVIL